MITLCMCARRAKLQSNYSAVLGKQQLPEHVFAPLVRMSFPRAQGKHLLGQCPFLEA